MRRGTCEGCGEDADLFRVGEKPGQEDAEGRELCAPCIHRRIVEVQA